MFGFGKVEISVNRLAMVMAETTLQPLENPSNEDRARLEEATKAGADGNSFVMEVVALQVFTMVTAVNMRLQTRAVKRETAEHSIIRTFGFTTIRLLAKTRKFVIRQQLRFS